MAIQWRHRLATGEVRPWTLKEIVQGKPLGTPTHPMFVVFPIAFYVGTLGLDVLSRLGRFPQAPIAGTWLILGAFAGTAIAVTTGLVDRSTMRPGSGVRGIATRHMLLQFATAAIFVANLAVRWSGRHQARSDVLWIVLDALGVAILSFASHLGGVLVYKIGFRVGPGEAPPQP